MADGGEGTVHALVSADNGILQEVEVTGPLGKKVKAQFGLYHQKQRAVLEMASASGIALLDRKELDPMKASTYGTGELIRAILDMGIRHITIGIGGSATVDGGAGMAQALGYRLLDAAGNELPPGGGALCNLCTIDAGMADPRLAETEFCVACDVTSPLLGPEGAAAVFGPQKGATPEMIPVLEKGLSVLASVWKKQNMLDRVDAPGDGAAGGLGAVLKAFCKAVPESGAKLVMKALDFEKHLQGADLVITGEGRTDDQTEAGKICGEIANVSHRYNIPVLLLSGSLEGNLDSFLNTFDYAFSTSSGHTSLEATLA